MYYILTQYEIKITKQFLIIDHKTYINEGYLSTYNLYLKQVSILFRVYSNIGM